jgi:Membrane domain of glycerophosphoryl diester phosphodiesterase
MNDTTPRPERAVTLRPRRPGAILGAAFELYQRQLLRLIAISAVLVVPGGILNWRQSCSKGACRIMVFDGEVVSTSFWATTAWVLVAPIALLMVCAVVVAVTTRAVTAQLAGEDPGLWPSARSTFARPRSLLQVVILVVGSMTVLVLVMLPGMSLTGSGGPLANAVVGVTLVLLVVAGLTVGVRLAVSIPAVVVEGRSWRHALSRSWSLVGGNWGHVLRTLFLAFVAISLVGTLVNVFIGILVGMLAGDEWLARTLVQAAINALTLSYFLTVWVLLYLDLRTRKEPLDLDTLRADLRTSEA